MKTPKLEFVKENWSWGLVLLAILINGGVTSPMSVFAWIFTGVQRDFNATTVQTGLIGSAAFSTCYLTSPLALVVEGALGLHVTVVLSATLTTIVLFVSSYMTNFWGLMLSYGVAYGTLCCFTLHSSFCILFRYFDRSKRSKVSSIVYAGISVSTAVLSLLYVHLIDLFGWRLTLRFSALYTLILAVPCSFFMSPKKDGIRTRHVSRQVDVNSAVTIKKEDQELDFEAHKMKVPTISEKLALGAADNGGDKRKTMRHMITSTNAWMILFAVFLPGMAWTAYWTNIVSYFQSLAMTEHAIFVNVTIITLFELLGRAALALFIDKLPFREVNTLILINLIFFVVTTLFALRPTEAVVLFCSVVIGVGRGWAIILPYNATAELMKGYHVDHTVTLTMLALGVGFTAGSVPTGAVYDATNSYSWAFLLNALFFLLGATLLVLLKVQRRCKKTRKRRRILQMQSQVKQLKYLAPSVDHAGVAKEYPSCRFKENILPSGSINYAYVTDGCPS